MKTALLFAGQGAQYTGMGKSLFENSKAAREIFEIADSIRKGTSADCFTADSTQLSNTLVTQPCLFAADLAAGAAVRERGIEISAVAGFSLGEMPALAFSGAIDTKAAFELTVKRAQFMDEAAQKNPGAMAAVLKLSPEEITQVCQELTDVWPVNFNSSAQTVIAGSHEGIALAAKALAEKKAKVVKLAVSGAFHSPFMKSASDQFAEVLDKVQISDPNIPVYSNVTGNVYTTEEIKSLLSKQICSAVQWVKTINHMTAEGIDTFIEAGPGKTLTGLVKRIAPKANVFNVSEFEDLSKL